MDTTDKKFLLNFQVHLACVAECYEKMGKGFASSAAHRIFAKNTRWINKYYFLLRGEQISGDF